jgi:hypothetical protein
LCLYGKYYLLFVVVFILNKDYFLVEAAYLKAIRASLHSDFIPLGLRNNVDYPEEWPLATLECKVIYLFVL